jgi:hypothetical protein
MKQRKTCKPDTETLALLPDGVLPGLGSGCSAQPDRPTLRK